MWNDHIVYSDDDFSHVCHCRLTWSATWCLRLFMLSPCINLRSLFGWVQMISNFCRFKINFWRSQFGFKKNPRIFRSNFENYILQISGQVWQILIWFQIHPILFSPSCHPCPGGKGDPLPGEFLTKAFFVWNNYKSPRVVHDFTDIHGGEKGDIVGFFTFTESEMEERRGI